MHSINFIPVLQTILTFISTVSQYFTHQRPLGIANGLTFNESKREPYKQSKSVTIHCEIMCNNSLK